MLQILVLIIRRNSTTLIDARKQLFFSRYDHLWSKCYVRHAGWPAGRRVWQRIHVHVTELADSASEEHQPHHGPDPKPPRQLLLLPWPALTSSNCHFPTCQGINLDYIKFNGFTRDGIIIPYDYSYTYESHIETFARIIQLSNLLQMLLYYCSLSHFSEYDYIHKHI